MPYSITTKDGITINDIPDDLAPDAPELKRRVQAIRAQMQSEAPPEGATEAAEPPTPSDPRASMGLLAKIGETITGAARSTPQTQGLPEWTAMPELNSFSMASFKTGAGTLLASPDEIVKVLQSNFPGVQVGRDAKANYILKSSIDGKEYAIPPGLSLGDTPRVLGGALAFTPAGRATTVAGAAGKSVLTQGTIEATQAATGGEVNPPDVLTAGLVGGAVPLAGKALRATVVEPAKKIVQSFRSSATPAAAPAGVPAALAPTAGKELSKDDLDSLVRDASTRGFVSPAAQERLAEAARINPEARAQAERLGIDLPADVFSDNAQVRSLAGLTRSVAGSDAEAGWRNTVSQAVDKADDVIKQFDAAFVDGAPSPGVASQRVRDSLIGEHGNIRQQAKALYSKVDEQVPKTTPVQTKNVRAVLDSIRAEVGEQGVSAQEKRLLAMLDQSPTYGRLMREKDLIGQALGGKQSPYGDMHGASLKRLYGALAQDQLDTIEEIGGQSLRQELRAANLLTAKEKALGKRIVAAFGNDMEGSIANSMKSAMVGAAGGDAGRLTRLLKTIPEDLRKETVATALASVTRSTRGAERGGFGFAEYVKFYQGLRANSPAYKQVVDALGPQSHAIMTDLYGVAKRLTDARANVLTTGKANQALQPLETLTGRVLGAIADSAVARAGVTAASSAGGGPVGAGAASGLMHILTSGKRDVMKEAGKLFASPEFQKLAVEMGSGQVSRQTSAKMLASRAFLDFAQAARIPASARERWLLNVTQSSSNVSQLSAGN